MKKFVACSALMISIICNMATIMAANSKDSNAIYPQFNTADWSSMQKIIVVRNENNKDPFIQEARKRNIPITYDLKHMLKKDFMYFKTIIWIVRNGELSLSLDPKEPDSIDKANSWKEAVSFFENDPVYLKIDNPTKFESLHNQYKCHADWARGLKTPWNIEPEKPDKGYWGFVANKCN